MSWMVSRQSFTLRFCFQSQVYVCGIRGGQIGTKTGFPHTTSVFPCEYHYINYILHKLHKLIIKISTFIHSSFEDNVT